MIAFLLAAAAVLVLCWPSPRKDGGGLLFPPAVMPPPPAPPAPPRGGSYETALRSLSQVRSRLSATQSLDDKARAAVDVLTLALVNGSDAE